MQQSKGNISTFMSQVPNHLKDEVQKQLDDAIKQLSKKEVQIQLQEFEDNKHKIPLISEHRIKLKALYSIIVKIHAQKLAYLIDKYTVITYFVNGNHEPIYFPNLVQSNLKNKELFIDLAQAKGIVDANGISIAGLPNVRALMPYLHEIYSEKELNSMFSHQRTPKPILHNNVHVITLENSQNHTQDNDWQRIMGDKKIQFDVFFTHGQVGKGAWRDDKQANEMPTLHVAAMLSYLAQLTVDGHLHTTHEMKNSLEKDTIRAVGNCGFLIKKDNNSILREKIEVDGPYDPRGKISIEEIDVEKALLDEIFERV